MAKKTKNASEYVKEPNPPCTPWHERRQGYTPELSEEPMVRGKGGPTNKGTKKIRPPQGY